MNITLFNSANIGGAQTESPGLWRNTQLRRRGLFTRGGFDEYH